MDKVKKKYMNRKTLKINENNDIDSIIEIFQRFGKKYRIVTTTLEPNIQYETKNTKITQTYTQTILKSKLKDMISKLKESGNITLIVINNSQPNKRKKVNYKISRLKKLDNVNIKEIEEKDTFKTLDNIIRDA